MSGRDSTYLAPCGDGSSVLERVLMAIIAAHTTPETEGHQQERLDAAMTALTGPVMDHERRLDQAVRFMVRERQRDICEAEMAVLPVSQATGAVSPRPLAQLAEAAAREVMGCRERAELPALTRDLCARYRALVRTQPVEPDPFMAALEDEAVQRIISELAEWGIPARF
ncbi:MAG: hypothetical protein Kow0032_09130 [Methyloligellaceae bacterium]